MSQLLPGGMCGGSGAVRALPREPGAPEHPRGAAPVPALRSSGRSGHSQRALLCSQRLFSLGLPCFQVTLLPVHADGWMGAGLLGQRWVWGPAGIELLWGGDVGELRLFTCSEVGSLCPCLSCWCWCLSLPHGPQSVRLPGAAGTWPRAPAHPALASCSLGSQPESSLRLRCGPGSVPAPSRRLWEWLCGEKLRGDSAGSWQGSAGSFPGSEGVHAPQHLQVDFRAGIKERDCCYIVNGKTSCNIAQSFLESGSSTV